MRLTDHDLKQLSQAYWASLAPERLLHLSKKMLDDLRDARDRLNQTQQSNHSLPPPDCLTELTFCPENEICQSISPPP
ncbi:MAG: hypothetical protein IAE79_24095 [Anaerolinea sp.]|nr:hypothetical protein [Anaerolinea sp.]